VLLNGSEHDVVARWLEVVKDYTRLKLTFPTDKLPAVAGLARQFRQYRRGNYLAGLWNDSLFEDLLWFAQPPAPKPSIWRAPSWSWAAIDSPVNHHKDLFMGDKIRPMCNYDDYMCTLAAGDDEFGELKCNYAYLMLSGYLVPVRVRHRVPKKDSEERAFWCCKGGSC